MNALDGFYQFGLADGTVYPPNAGITALFKFTDGSIRDIFEQKYLDLVSGI